MEIVCRLYSCLNDLQSGTTFGSIHLPGLRFMNPTLTIHVHTEVFLGRRGGFLRWWINVTCNTADDYRLRFRRRHPSHLPSPTVAAPPAGGTLGVDRGLGPSSAQASGGSVHGGRCLRSEGHPSGVFCSGRHTEEAAATELCPEPEKKRPLLRR